MACKTYDCCDENFPGDYVDRVRREACYAQVDYLPDEVLDAVTEVQEVRDDLYDGATEFVSDSADTIVDVGGDVLYTAGNTATLGGLGGVMDYIEKKDEDEKREEEFAEAQSEAAAAQEEYLEALSARTDAFGSPENIPLMEQCALMSLFDYLTAVSYGSDTDPTGVHNPNLVLVQDKKPDSGTGMLMHKLVTNPKYTGFYSLTPAKLSALVPKIRLYFVFEKVRRDVDIIASGYTVSSTDPIPGGPVSALIPFYSNIGSDIRSLAGNSDVAAVLQSSEQRGWGAGIKSFEWDMFGKTTFTADKDIRAELKLYFASFDEFIKDRVLPVDIQTSAITFDQPGQSLEAGPGAGAAENIESVSFKYSDLASYDGSYLDNLGYTLKADVGWEWTAENAEYLKANFGFTDSELEAVENSTHSLVLRKTTHKIEVNDDGSVDLEIQYIANSAGVLEHDRCCNILLSEPLIELHSDYEIMMEQLRKCPEGDARSNAIQDLQDAYNDLKESLLKAQVLRIISLLDGETKFPTGVGTVQVPESVGEAAGGTVDPTYSATSYVGVYRTVEECASNSRQNPYVDDYKIHSIGLPITAWKEIQKAGAPDSGAVKINAILQKYADELSESTADTIEVSAELEAEAKAAWEQSSKKQVLDDMESGQSGEIPKMGYSEEMRAETEQEFIEDYKREHGEQGHIDQVNTFATQMEIADTDGKYESQEDARMNSAMSGDAFTVDEITYGHHIGGMIGSEWNDLTGNDGELNLIDSVNVMSAPITTPGNITVEYGLGKLLGHAHGDHSATGKWEKKQTKKFEEQAEIYEQYTEELKYKRVYYVYFKDLMDAIFYIMKSNALALGKSEKNKDDSYYFDKINKFRLVLGNMEIMYEDKAPSSFGSGEVDHYMIRNLGNVPISLALLRKFLINNIVLPKTKSYNFLQFAKDVIEELIIGPINDSQCWGHSIYQSPSHARVNHIDPPGFAGKRPQYFSIHNTIVSGAPRGSAEVFDLRRYGKSSEGMGLDVLQDSNFMIDLTSVSDSELPLLKQDTPSDPVSAIDMYDYCIFYLPQIKEGRRGDFDADIRDGIYHYYIGSNKGIVKSIKFSKSDHKGLREARIEAAGDAREGLYQMTDRYDATIELYGNAKVIPGSSIYINAKSFSAAMGDPWQGPAEGSSYYKNAAQDNITVDESDLAAASPSWILGIGGYYLVSQVTSKIEPGEFSTTLKALWTDGGEMFMPPSAEDRETDDLSTSCNQFAQETSFSIDEDGQIVPSGMLGFAARGEGLSEQSPLLAASIGKTADRRLQARDQAQMDAKNQKAAKEAEEGMFGGFFSDIGEGMGL